MSVAAIVALAARRAHHGRRSTPWSGFEVTPGDRDRPADHPRLLAVRHRGGLRQGAGEHPGVHHQPVADVRRAGQPGGQPDPGPLDQHLGHRAAAGRWRCCSSAPWSLGTGPLKDLALALFVGMAAGAYSSIFIATPLAVQLKEREPAVQGAGEAGRGPAGAGADAPPATPTADGDAEPRRRRRRLRRRWSRSPPGAGPRRRRDRRRRGRRARRARTGTPGPARTPGRSASRSPSATAITAREGSER